MNAPQKPIVPIVDQYSKDFRASVEIEARIELKKLAIEDKRFNDPMMAAKFLAEKEISGGF